jgi:hypothetical protein
MFLTKVWGWSMPVGPLQFNSAGWRENALRQLKPGDLVLHVGTKSAQTPDAMKGNALGIIEPSREPVASLDYDIRKRPDDYVDGQYKWPFGLAILNAWSLPDMPPLSTISDRSFGMDAAQGIIRLDPSEEQRVRLFAWRQEALLPLSANAQTRLARRDIAVRQSSPIPVTTRAGVMHMRQEPAYTYALTITDTQAMRSLGYKIGWAFDYERRMRQFNQAALPSLGGLRYTKPIFHRWNTARLAFHMEQALLRHFQRWRSAQNHEVIVGVPVKQFEAAWAAAYSGTLER